MTNTTQAPNSVTPVIAPLLKKEDLDLANGADTATTAAAPAAIEAKPVAPKADAKAEKVAEPGLAPPPSKEDARKFAREFLLGEMVKAVKCHFVTLSQPFTKLSQMQQESVLRRVADDLSRVTKEVIDIVASDARLTFRADVDSVTFKDGVKVAMKLAKSEHAHTLADKSGSSVLIVVEDYARYLDPGAELVGEPDQKPLFDAAQAAKNEKDAADKLAPARPPSKKKSAKKPAGRTPARKGRGK